MFESKNHPLHDHFVGWTTADIEDHLDVWRRRGPEAMKEWITNGKDMVTVMECASSLREYDDYRVSNYDCISCMSKRAERRWESGEFQKVMRAELNGDIATYEYLFGKQVG